MTPNQLLKPLFCVLLIALAGISVSANTIRITANFTGEAVSPDFELQLRTSRTLEPGDGRLALLLGDTDITAFCESNINGLTFNPGTIRLPIGETTAIVYLVSATNDWAEIARLPLRVEQPKATTPSSGNGTPGNTETPAKAETSAQMSQSPGPFNFIPSVSVNLKGQSTALYFPDSSRPARLNFTDVAVQATLQGNYQQRALSIQNQFDLAGSSVQNEALRFGQLGNDAMQLDLSSYTMRYQFHRANLQLGQVSFGSNRHLINSFSSRGFSVTVPIKNRFDVSGAIMNGTSIVGFNNFFGLDRSTHQIRSLTLGTELLPKRPSGLRVEVSWLHGSLLPLDNFNESSINDAERSRGAAIRVIGSDKSQRLRFDAGFARSRFTNPRDPLLFQNRDVIPVKEVSRNGRYLDVSFDLLKGYKISEARPLSLSLSYKHEQVDPLYKSVAAFSQADRLSNQFDMTGTLGTITFGVGHTRGNDNLNGIRSILQTLNRRTAFSLATPAYALFTGEDKSSKWLPRLSYTFDRMHQAAAFVPVNGDFNATSHMPDQISTNQTFGAEWQLVSTLRAGYRFNHSFQDNRQPTRTRNDLLSIVNGVTVGFNPTRTLDLNFDIGTERSSAFDQNTVNSTFRVGTNITWRMNTKMVWTVNASTTGAGDHANTNHRRDADVDAQFSWRFLNTEKNRLKKVQGQFFIRYANRYGYARDFLFGFNTYTKLQTFNAGLNFIFF